MAEVPLAFLVHKVDVSTYSGTGALGDTFAAPVEIPCLIEQTRRLVRSLDGEEVVSEASIVMRREWIPTCTPRSKISFNGRDTEIIAASDRSDGGLGAWQHLSIATG